jgi:hypothetical protein
LIKFISRNTKKEILSNKNQTKKYITHPDVWTANLVTAPFLLQIWVWSLSSSHIHRFVRFCWARGRYNSTTAQNIFNKMAAHCTAICCYKPTEHANTIGCKWK